jgi:hypothetical protein
MSVRQGAASEHQEQPACSNIKLRRMGLSQSLHFTRPISEVEVSGWAPKSFMSRAESHEVGGEGSEAGSSGGEGGRRLSQEKGEAGSDGLSLRGIK